VRVSTYDKIAWLPLCGGLTGLGLVLSYLAMRRRGIGVGLRWAAWSLLPIAAYLTGSIEMFWKMGVAIGDFAKGFAFSPNNLTVPVGTKVTWEFKDSAKQQFANNFDFPAGSCEDAVRQLNARIDKSQRGYKNTWSDYQGLPLSVNGVNLKSPPSGVTSVEISSCEVTVSPKLGWFKVEKVDRDQWIITQHRRETC